MRRKDKEITDSGIIREILEKAQICRIAMFDDEFPYIVPFNYGYSNNKIYLHTAGNGKKIELLKKNNNVCFEVEHACQVVRHEQSCNWTTKYRSVIGYGKIEIVRNNEGKKKGLDIIMSHYGNHEDNHYDENHLENLVILEMTISRLTGKQSGDWSDD